MMIMNSWRYNAFVAVAAIMLLASCKPSVPRKYIQPDEMEEILYDMHLARGIVEAEGKEAKKAAFDQQLYRNAVLRKHGVSLADFDSSMVYYNRHTDRLHVIYENLSKRLNDAAVALGASTSDATRYKTITNTGDTANIWRGDRAAVFMVYAPYNRLTFAMEADTSFHKGDKLMLNFETQFLYQDGAKDAVAMLAVRLSNDSVMSRVIHLSSSTDYSLTLTDDKHLGIKEVRGFICLNNNDANSTTLRLMFVDGIQLIRMHEGKQKDKDKQDATATPQKADSTGDNAPMPIRHGRPLPPDAIDRDAAIEPLATEPTAQKE